MMSAFASLASRTSGDYAAEGRSKDAAESLTYLNEFSEIRSEYLQLCQQIYTDTGADEIYWRIESGNMMTLVTSAGAVPTIASVEGMNEKLAGQRIEKRRQRDYIVMKAPETEQIEKAAD